MACVLVVDDNEGLRRLVPVTLLAAGHEAFEAAEAISAWRAMVAHRPDVVILDVTMPAVSGLDLCRAMRADPQLAAMPVIVPAGRGLPEDRAAASDAGADRFFAKAFSPRDLLAAVDDLAGGGQARGRATA
jgi:DNA-binding response OmpR family regulator